ncbi:Uncharacterized protein APZ42_002225, partial [Daphnia magna]
ALGAGGGQADLVTGLAQGLGHQLGQAFVVFHKQDGGGHSSEASGQDVVRARSDGGNLPAPTGLDQLHGFLAAALEGLAVQDAALA